MLGNVFNQILYLPIFNALIFLYNVIPGHDFGIAIILLTILVRIILSPLAYYSIKSRQSLALIQPKIKEIQQKYKSKEEQSRELMKAYKEHGVNPFSGCLPLVIQLPILWALYRVFINVLKPENLSALYGFIKNPGTINSSFLGIMDLSVPSYVLAILAGVSQFLYSKLTMKYSPQMPQTDAKKGVGQGIQKVMSQQMVYFMPILTIIIALRLPAGLSLYWFLSTLLGFVQDYFLLKRKNWSQSGKALTG